MEPIGPGMSRAGWVFCFMPRLISIVMLLIVAWMFTGANSSSPPKPSKNFLLVKHNLDTNTWVLRIQNRTLGVDCVGYCDFTVEPDLFLVNELSERTVEGTWSLAEPRPRRYEVTFNFKDANCSRIHPSTAMKFQVTDPYNPKRIGLRFIADHGDSTMMKLSRR